RAEGGALALDGPAARREVGAAGRQADYSRREQSGSRALGWPEQTRQPRRISPESDGRGVRRRPPPRGDGIAHRIRARWALVQDSRTGEVDGQSVEGARYDLGVPAETRLDGCAAMSGGSRIQTPQFDRRLPGGG